jgi:uncharacterized protein (TIGR03067 family)
MKRNQIAVLVALATLVISIARAGDDEAAKKDLAQLQGEWTMVSGSAGGQPMPGQMVGQMKRVCKGDEITITMAGEIYFKATIILDPTKTPKTIDYQMTQGFSKGKKQLGIYEVEGNRLKSCFGAPDAERPTDFTTKPGDGRTASVWKREKAAATAPEPK